MELGKLDLRKFAVIFMILYSIMPFVGVAVSVYFTTYSYMVFCVLFLILIILGKKTKSMDEYFAYLLPFILYETMTFFVITDSISLWGYRVLLFILPVVLGVYIVSYHKDECALYSRIIFLCIIITCITTARGLQVYSGASRWLATANNSKDYINITLSWMNVGGYNFVYTVVLLYPLLILAFKRNKINLMMTLIVASIAFWCLISAEYTMAILLFVITSTLFFVKKNLKVSNIVIYTIIAGIFAFLFSGFLSRVLIAIAEKIESDTIAVRLKDLSGGMKGLENSTDNRVELYMRSIKTFITHPLGTFLFGGRGIGFHSFILDSLAQFGFIGGWIIISMYHKIYKFFYEKYENEEDFGYIMWIFIQAIVVSLLNTGFWLDILAFYVPVVLTFLYGGNNEKSSLDSKHIAKTN